MNPRPASQMVGRAPDIRCGGPPSLSTNSSHPLSAQPAVYATLPFTLPAVPCIRLWNLIAMRNGPASQMTSQISRLKRRSKLWAVMHRARTGSSGLGSLNSREGGTFHISNTTCFYTTGRRNVHRGRFYVDARYHFGHHSGPGNRR